MRWGWPILGCPFCVHAKPPTGSGWLLRGALYALCFCSGGGGPSRTLQVVVGMCGGYVLEEGWAVHGSCAVVPLGSLSRALPAVLWGPAGARPQAAAWKVSGNSTTQETGALPLSGVGAGGVPTGCPHAGVPLVR